MAFCFAKKLLPLLVLVDDHQAIGHTGIGLWQIDGVMNSKAAQPQQVFTAGLGEMLGGYIDIDAVFVRIADDFVFLKGIGISPLPVATQ